MANHTQDIPQNNFLVRKVTTLRKQIERKNTVTKQQKKNTEGKKNKWTTFTYYSPKIRKITNLFKHTDINVPFKSSNSIQRITNVDTTNRTQKYKCRGIYALTCKICKHKYIGHTSRELKQRYQEHTRYITNNNPQSALALHILDNKHEYGTIEELMEMVKPIKNKRLLIPFEQFYIQKHHQENKLVTEQHPGEHNPLIQLAIDTTKTSNEQNQ
jgi:hypothetical protein